MEFRKLKAEEIECRIQSVKDTEKSKGAILLLYKDARVDQRILDETVGAMNWQRHHSRDNRNCVVSIWDEEKKFWVEKEDTGTESNTEAEKGLASDSFKRACFNWGIGRELYSAPFIWVSDAKITNGKCYDKFKVTSIGYDGNGDINALEIYNESLKRVCYRLGQKESAKVDEKQRPKLIDEIHSIVTEKKLNLAKLYAKAGVKNLNELSTDRMPGMIDWLNGLSEDKLNELRGEK